MAPSGDTKVAVTTVAKGLEHPWSLAFLPDGRMLVTERPGRLRYRDAGRRALGAGRRRAGRRCRGPGRPARRDPRPALRGKLDDLPVVRRTGSGRDERHRGRARAPRRRRARRRQGHLPPAAEVQEQPSLRLAPRLRARRQPVRHDRRAQFAARQGPGPRHAHRQGPAHHARRRRAGGQPLRRPRRARCRKSGRMATATCRARRCIPETGRALDARARPARRRRDQHRRARAATTAGRSSPTAASTAAPAIGEGTAKAGMEQPVHYWVPSIAPSGMAFHDGRGFPAWKGQLFVGALAADAARSPRRRAGRQGAPRGAHRASASACATCAKVRTARSTS